jgi:hypothetical protein
MNETGHHHTKQNKSDLEIQISHIFPHIWNVDLKMKKEMNVK